jgi:hypothetical protein
MKQTRKVALPEPEVLKELHRVRRSIQRRAEKVGWTRYLEELNARPSVLGTTKRLAVHERPKKEYASRK